MLNRLIAFSLRNRLFVLAAGALLMAYGIFVGVNEGYWSIRSFRTNQGATLLLRTIRRGAKGISGQPQNTTT